MQANRISDNLAPTSSGQEESMEDYATRIMDSLRMTMGFTPSLTAVLTSNDSGWDFPQTELQKRLEEAANKANPFNRSISKMEVDNIFSAYDLLMSNYTIAPTLFGRYLTFDNREDDYKFL